jgi:hypothetical protein
MKYLVFGNKVDIDNFIEGGVKTLEESNYPYETLSVEEQDGWIKNMDMASAMAKVEQYGSFCYISEKKYNKLNGN